MKTNSNNTIENSESAVNTAPKKNKYEMDMCNGPLASKMWIYVLPLMASGILQLAFNAVDIIVVGQCCGDDALAAVGATSSLINLLVNIFMGLSVGTNVLVAKFYGAGKQEHISETVHTAVTASVIFGAILAVIGFVSAKPLLQLMDTPDNIIDMSALYVRIYFLGMPVMLLYNFGSAVLRAIGDTKRPLYFLFAAGVLNVFLNLFFVIVCHMTVDGVALATIISQAVSAALIVVCLIRSEGGCHLELKRLRIVPDKLLSMIKIGLPAGIQGSLFSLSNVLIQSSVNSFGSAVVSGNTAASNLEGFIYVAMNSFHQTAISFTSQNLGGGKYKRISRIMLYSVGFVTLVGVSLGCIFYLAAPQLLRLYTKDPQVIEYGIIRMSVICTTYFLCGVMDVMVGVLRGLGKSILPMIVSLCGACGFRIIWIMTVFKLNHTLFTLYISYPISWFLTAATHIVCYIIVKKQLNKRVTGCSPAA